MLGFNAFSGRACAKAAPQCTDRLHNGNAVLVARQVANEGLIDLDLVKREAAQIAQAGIPGAKIVHRYVHAKLTKLAENGEILLTLIKKDRFGDLELQPA